LDWGNECCEWLDWAKGGAAKRAYGQRLKLIEKIAGQLMALATRSIGRESWYTGTLCGDGTHLLILSPQKLGGGRNLEISGAAHGENNLFF